LEGISQTDEAWRADLKKTGEDGGKDKLKEMKKKRGTFKKLYNKY